MVSLAQYPDLANKAVLVTGGASGIGAEIVTAFAAQGARVAFVDIDGAASVRLCASLPGVRHVVCDVTDVVALQAALAQLEQQAGPFSVLVNNVANDDRHPWQGVTAAYFDERVAVNLRPHFFAIQALAPAMIAAGGGAIINLGSISWMAKGCDYPVYATCKAAIMGLTRSFARELGPHRIRVNTLTPGWVMTGRQLALWVDQEAEADIARNQCLPDRLHGEDIAQMALFLASDASRMISAQEFIVDAGWI